MKPGEILGVIGPSGAGKSTLARIAAGAISPDAGEVRIDGANVNDWDPELLATHIGYLPQNLALLPGTVSENISRFALARGADKQRSTDCHRGSHAGRRSRNDPSFPERLRHAAAGGGA